MNCLVSGILIAGSSLVTRLQSHRHTPTRRHLCVPLPYTLVGKPGLRIKDVLALLQSSITTTHPAYIVLHVGANDIGSPDSWQWHHAVRELVAVLHSRYPASRLIFSDMLPRTNWRIFSKTGAAEATRKRYQRGKRHYYCPPHTRKRELFGAGRCPSYSRRPGHLRNRLCGGADFNHMLISDSHCSLTFSKLSIHL